MTDQIPEAVFWCLALGLFAVTVLLVRQHGITARQRRRNEELAHGLRARDTELRHLLTVRLPEVEDAADRTAPQTDLLDTGLADTDFAACLDEVLDRFAAAVEHAEARADESAKAAVKASMRSIQALANEQQVSIAEMQDRHDHPDVLRDLLEVDHTNAQFGRRAQAIAVLCGSWPGRQRATSALIEVVRGATSRIRDYRRIRINGEVDIAVQSRAVEPVVLAVAELLDNAARHSQPHTTVEVTIQTVHNGACVVIDDAGVGMDGQAVDHADELLSGRRTMDVTRLGDPPRFGFAVIGALAERYGFSVSAGTLSPYGGVRAVVFLPTGLLTHLETVQDAAPTATASEPGPTRYSAPEPTAARNSTPVRARASETAPARTAGHAPAPDRVPGPPPAVEPTSPAASTVETTPRSTAPSALAPGESTTAGGLPKRRRRSLREAAEKPAAVPTVEVGGRSAEENARRMGAFARGTRSGRTAQSTPYEDEGNRHE
ncbi:ATP-binding protein [Streptomyces luteolifulvus]|uniref:histidine kinase n=1 Tax=Streptomyces luteolifulvus TaxID=2615112 RepID=A0A6H9UQA2_9ACTN|nr:ATP-binding protein [Streptomyces luteolifulvus]KAB1139959.1 ATP-binding protein [Streptomyces luteolifulvus]